MHFSVALIPGEGESKRRVQDNEEEEDDDQAKAEAKGGTERKSHEVDKGISANSIGLEVQLSHGKARRGQSKAGSERLGRRCGVCYSR